MKAFGRILLSVLGWAFTLLCSGVIIGCIAMILLFKHYSKDLPEYSQLANYDPATVTRLYAADGKLLAEYASEKRVFVPLNAIPKRVIQAFLSAEDKNFYQHTGVDFSGIGRAIYTNVLNYGQAHSLVGGSTITQQVVKNFLLTNEKSLERKIKEAILAVRISQVYSKDKILELYLNEIFLGLRSYGIAAAALNYFNKSLEELTVEEAALLAALPKGPTLYDPRYHYADAKARRDWVIGRMLDDGHLAPEEAKAAVATPITLRSRAANDIAEADFFAEEVRRWLADKYGKNVLYESGLVVKTTVEPALQKIADHALRSALTDYDRRRGYRGAVRHLLSMDGWKAALEQMQKEDHQLVENQMLAVVTHVEANKAVIGFADGKTGAIPLSLLKWTRRVMEGGALGKEIKKASDVLNIGDVVIVAPASEEQKKHLLEAERKIAWDLQQVPAVNGALVALDPHTGKVLALSGGYAYGGTAFNRATQARRQPGSAFKPLVYMAALENGFTPSTIIMDSPVEMSQGVGLPTWKPQNYGDDYLGPITLRTGLEKSRNTVTVRVAQIIGINRVLEIGKRLGVYDDPPRNFSIVLGTSETTLLKLANAYGMIVNGGKKITPALVERIEDRQGKTIFRRDERPCPGCFVHNIDKVAPDASPPRIEDTRPQIIDPRIAYQITSMMEGVVQRGTATRAKALGAPIAGKTGTTNDSNDTWFIGATPDLVVGVFVGYDRPQTLGKKETGGSVALPGFITFMQEALKNVPPKPFRIPSGIQLVRVDRHTGQPIEPGVESDNVIQEVFITGGPIFRPGHDNDSTQPLPEGTGEVLTLPGATEDSPPLPWLQPSTPLPAPDPGNQPNRAIGTGGLY